MTTAYENNTYDKTPQESNSYEKHSHEKTPYENNTYENNLGKTRKENNMQPTQGHDI